MEKPTNLAQLKAYLKPGVKLKLVQAPYITDGVPLNREITKVQSNGFYMNGDRIPEGTGGGNGSWLEFRPAKFYQFNEKGFSACREIGGKLEPVLVYEFV